jgi:hypothetical protein
MIEGILGTIFGLVLGYLIFYPKGFREGKKYMIDKKRRYDKSR